MLRLLLHGRKERPSSLPLLDPKPSPPTGQPYFMAGITLHLKSSLIQNLRPLGHIVPEKLRFASEANKNPAETSRRLGRLTKESIQVPFA